MAPWGLLAWATFSCSWAISLDEIDYSPEDIITRDVAIVGGGASGTYAAVRLQQDLRKSVVVVERKNVLGGHTETYHDPVTGSIIDIGVLAFHDLPIVHDFFDRFDIPLDKLTFNLAGLERVDFRTGNPVTVFIDPNETQLALSRWAAHLARFPTLNDGFVFPFPVPDDLLLSFREFVAKYNLAAIVSSIWSVAQGYGDILSLPTLYVLKIFGPHILHSLSTGFFSTRRQNNHQVYEKALQSLGEDTNVFLNSVIVSMARDLPGSFARAVVRTPSGYKLLRAKQFLFTLPPKLDHLSGFDLDGEEINLFSQFSSIDYYTGLLRDCPVPPNISLSNMVADPSTFYLPRLPTCYTLGLIQSSSNLTNVKFSSNITTMGVGEVRAQITAEARTVVAGSRPSLAVLSNHGPFGLQVSANAIRHGFYQKLNRLQGRRRSFWTGAAWHVHDSALLWNFTEGILTHMQLSDCP
ncbi:hypothetical protein NUU61_004658 [Penicillium alfredii]|uniref:Amine oxidase domain-containing protein n=1 Tax=Penicillium alfredii TaxID=1506179 RepID=A0A9W9KE23_9EURO|nr:uncharacterized protein NUU61_004658 [Penicillium alfredii]KAJ5102436.1 hypothetical protein NUU61_004658 [Penicillium alfredii]